MHVKDPVENLGPLHAFLTQPPTRALLLSVFAYQEMEKVTFPRSVCYLSLSWLQEPTLLSSSSCVLVLCSKYSPTLLMGSQDPHRNGFNMTQLDSVKQWNFMIITFFWSEFHFIYFLAALCRMRDLSS